MHRRLPLLLMTSGFALIAALAYASFRGMPGSGFFLREELPPTTVMAGFQAYTADDVGLRFWYPELYHLRTVEVGTAARPQRTLTLVEDTPENLAVLDGQAPVGREGPTSITIEVHANPADLSAESWALAQTNWIARAAPLDTVRVADQVGVSYSWDGLYAGRSAIVSHEGHAYVFSVTWMSDEDRILSDYQALLASVRFAEPTGRR